MKKRKSNFVFKKSALLAFRGGLHMPNLDLMI